MSKAQRQLRKLFNWKTGVGVLAVLLIVLIVGQIAGWWPWAVTGTVFPNPPDGYTCLPTCSETDGKFLSMPGEDMASFGGEKAVVWIGVPDGNPSFEIGFFDGDSGKDWATGNWDNTTTETTYTLYADPLKNGAGSEVVAQWSSNDMPNNAWFNQVLNVGDNAKAPSGHYFYRLELTRPVQGYGINALKLRSTGYLSTGQADLVDASFAIVGMLATGNDKATLYPNYQSYSNMGPSTYTGEWDFYFYLPTAEGTVEFWDGDFDRGSSTTTAADSDDPNTDGKPAWASPYAVDERAGGRGAPADDFVNLLYRRTPPVWYEIIDPAGQPIHTNNEPSGTEEWERFVVSTDPAVNADLHVSALQPGWYNWHIVGLDLHNTVWIRTNYEMAPIPPPPVWPEGSCPRTIGYWKNNVKKVLIDGKTNGVQESRESLEQGLDNVAASSELFRSGVDLCAPAPIGNPVRLTDQEAHRILQRSKKDYPGCDENSMLARALQQNLATWLNLGTGKIGPNTVLSLNTPSGLFEGTAWEALMEAQNIILYERDNAARLEYAKDIADYINNGLLGEEAEDSVCEDYAEVIPPDKQPPPYEDLPEAPAPPAPPPPVVGCDAPRVNTYGVENPTNNPFPGIKFEYQSGTEVKDGAWDLYRVTIPSGDAANLGSVQLEAKAGQDQVIADANLSGCDFDNFTPCEAEVESGGFIFSFQGAVDNGDGTMTLTFQVQNNTNHGISHVTIGLPNAIWGGGNYQSEVCP
ncbi:MAG: hypothetical protein JXA37_02590 [Chloroflexia bacterium]|nr:hypothetical protein [Chloroflexia bacterium]